MKKIINYIRLIILVSLFYIPTLNALSGIVTPSVGLNVRATPSTTATIIDKLEYNQTIYILDTVTTTNSGCESEKWYKTTNNLKTGYVCSAYIYTIDDSDQEPENPIDITELYETELAKFPTDYQNKIKTLHNIYPNAIFTPFKTNVDWNTFLALEYDGYYKGWSLIWDSNGSYDGLKSTDSWSYSFYTNVFVQNFSGGGTNWYAASKQTIGYYMDPRNFLTKENIFMFEKLSYNSNYHTKAGVEKILQGSFMANTKITGATDKTFADAFIDAAKKTQISPYFLASRVIQEIGRTRTTMVSGTYAGYEGYYNFYNIKAAGTTPDATIKAGLAHAKSQGWNNEYKAIVEGASFVGNDYISQGQDTLYLQKWDVFPPNYVRHQYMQNIQAPMTESVQVHNAYNSMGLLNSYFVFSIPVFNSMPTSTSLANPNNPNNYLKDLTINGATVPNFDGAKTDYTINVSPLINSVQISATKVYSGSTLTGTGTITLTGLSQTIQIPVTAKNGSVKTYKITITRDATIPVAISEILNTMLINSDGTYISSIKIGTTIEEFTNHLTEVSASSTATFTNNDSQPKTTGIIATGDQVKITSGGETQTFSAVVYGDLNGDGQINSADLLKLRQHLLGTSTLKNAYYEAGNTTKSGNPINSADLLKLRQHLLGTSLIVQ